MTGGWPKERILGKHLVDRPLAHMDAGELPPSAVQLFLVSLLLADDKGVLTRAQIEEDAPQLAELGTVDVRPFERDPGFVRIRFIPRPGAKPPRRSRPGRDG